MSEEQKEKPHGCKLFSWGETTPNACGLSTGAVFGASWRSPTDEKSIV